MQQLTDLITDWMPSQRWFAGAGAPRLRALGSFELQQPATRVDGARQSAPGGSEASPVILVGIVADESGRESGNRPVVYQVPIVLRPIQPAPDHREAEPEGFLGVIERGGVQYAAIDGPRDELFAAALLDLITGEREVRSGDAPDAVSVTGHLSASDLAGTPVSTSVLRGEQSNTSIIYRMRGADGAEAPPLIIKVFRTIADGDNPDVVLQTELAAAGSSRVPPVLGNVRGRWVDPRVDGRRAAGHLAFAQRFFDGVEDAWRVALRAAGDGEAFVEDASKLGEATAETHAVLGDHLPTVPVDASRAAASVQLMRDRFDEAVSLVPELSSVRDAAFAVFAEAEGASWPSLQRIHGDYHLGQVLLVPDVGWVLLDFEGEPLRPLAERNEPDSTVRDVAGMLRSFDYVAGSLAMQAAEADAAGVEASSADPAREWASASRDAFIRGYRQGLADRGVAADAIERMLDARLLAAFELDKAVYETRYEALHRRDWLPIPLAAIDRILGTDQA